MGKGFGGGMPGNMQAIMQQAKKMQEQLKQAQAEAKELVADGSAGGGMVVVQASGENQILSIKINPEAINPADPEILEEMIMLACNNALTAAQARVQEKLTSITGGMNVPGLF